MRHPGEEKEYQLLAEHRLGRTGAQVKLDRGFETGVYAICVEYDGLADKIGFSAARRQALDYATMLHEQMARAPGYAIDGIEDASSHTDGQRQRDLENTFLSFILTSDDGRWHDDAVTRHFQLAAMRADQQWDQQQARVEEQRRCDRQERFRQHLSTLLAGESYRHLDGATKERLLVEVSALVVPAKGYER